MPWDLLQRVFSGHFLTLTQSGSDTALQRDQPPADELNINDQFQQI